ncbi:hypothetical protein C8R47DRAFT_1191473 [Mycena vitilis]|nr:hypothetical protein C8R47DRAFT_1191473 [Mycena vitilis]
MGKKQERRPKKRSAAQRAQSSTMRNGNKENEQPVPVATPAQQKPRDYKTAFENSQRKVRRMDVKEAKHKSVVLDLKKQLKAEQKAREAAVRSLENAAKRAAQIAAEREHRILVVHEKLLGAQRLTSDVQRENRALGKRVQRASGVLQRAIARTKAKPFTTQLMRRGMYTIHARQMAREIAGAGAAREKVGPLMTKIDKQRSMSRRTVSRSILEGGIAARMQLTHELSLNEGVTISADSTSHRGNNYESAKFQHRVPDYQKNPHYIDPTSTPRIRHAGVDSTLDHSSEKAVAGWKHRVESNAKVYNESPLAARLGKHFTIRHFLRTLKGMNGDHASVEKGTANGIGGWKHDEGVNELGQDALVSMSIADLVVYLQEWNAKKIANVGGVAAWEALSPTEQAVHDKRLMTEVDQNSFSGGNTEMLSEWERIGAPAPRLLVNKANSIAIQRLLEPGAKIPDTLTDLEQKALGDSTRGGVKLCAIAGAILKNKDSKKGQGDKHTDFMTYRVGKYHIWFPDTSNTRFGSYGLAAAELIKYLDVYRELMEVIEFSKTRPGLTNIEKNLRDALGDMSTLTELCAMILYQQIITHPYIRVLSRFLSVLARFFEKWDSVYAQDSYGSLSGWSACLLLAQERSPPSLFVWVTHSSGGCVAGSASFRQPSSVMSGFGVRNDQETISGFIRVLWSLATHRVLRELICWTMLHLESGGTLSHTGSSVPQAAEPDPHRGLRALPSGGNVLAPDLVLSDLAEHVYALTLNCREIPRLLEMLGTGLSHAVN